MRGRTVFESVMGEEIDWHSLVALTVLSVHVDELEVRDTLSPLSINNTLLSFLFIIADDDGFDMHCSIVGHILVRILPFGSQCSSNLIRAKRCRLSSALVYSRSFSIGLVKKRLY
jgi:hypothetical protein